MTSTIKVIIYCTSMLWLISPEEAESVCQKAADCSHVLTCTDGPCHCRPYHVQIGSKCLPAVLLDFPCELDAQCQLKVQNSSCKNGTCQCNSNYIPHLKHLCLPGAKISEVCQLEKQCSMMDHNSYCHFAIPKVYGNCKCRTGYEGIFGHCVSESQASQMRSVTIGKACNEDTECQKSDPNSICRSGICDCINPSNSCSANNTGCYKDTFQCRSGGKCLSWYYVCNGVAECCDGSDESECRKENCPPNTFKCRDGGCISKAWICDGKVDCPRDHSDEDGCHSRNHSLVCPKGSFRCNNGMCIPPYAYCNGILDCPDSSDEMEAACREGLQIRDCQFKCRNGNCRSSAILCSGKDGCGDASDEDHCSICSCPSSTGQQHILKNSFWHKNDN